MDSDSLQLGLHTRNAKIITLLEVGAKLMNKIIQLTIIPTQTPKKGGKVPETLQNF